MYSPNSLILPCAPGRFNQTRLRKTAQSHSLLIKLLWDMTINSKCFIDYSYNHYDGCFTEPFQVNVFAFFTVFLSFCYRTKNNWFLFVRVLLSEQRKKRSNSRPGQHVLDPLLEDPPQTQVPSVVLEESPLHYPSSLTVDPIKSDAISNSTIIQ